MIAIRLLLLIAAVELLNAFLLMLDAATAVAADRRVTHSPSIGHVERLLLLLLLSATRGRPVDGEESSLALGSVVATRFFTAAAATTAVGDEFSLLLARTAPVSSLLIAN
jgi:hypothetical protein